MKTIKELLEPITSKGLDLVVCVDTYDFEKFYESQGAPDGDFHKNIWHIMCDSYCDGAYVSYSRKDLEKNLLDKWINKFLDFYPEFGGRVNMIFTN